MDFLDQHFKAFQDRYPAASLKRVPNGTAVVAVPNWPLPEGWQPRETTVYFVVPVGYPAARPDCFWTDPVRLANGNVPKSAGNNQAEGLPPNVTWFSWHPATWNPNHDTLLTYIRMIGERLRRAE